MRRRATNARWLECLGVVTFDLQQGMRVECIQPNLTLSPEQEAEIAFLCFPDANLIVDGDNTHNFVFAFDPVVPLQQHELNHDENSSGVHCGSNKLPLSSKATELFGVARFRQKKDPSIPRGALQKSVFALSRFPFTAFLEKFCKNLFTKILDDPDEQYTTKEFRRKNPDVKDAEEETFISNRMQKNTAALANLSELLGSVMEDVSRWPRVASSRHYSVASCGTGTIELDTPHFIETTSGQATYLLGARPPPRTIASHVRIRDYTSVQQLRNLLSFPVETVLGAKNRPLLNSIFQQLTARHEHWFLDWCEQHHSNNSNNNSNVVLTSQEDVVSLTEACWDAWISGAEGFEDIPPSPSGEHYHPQKLLQNQQNVHPDPTGVNPNHSADPILLLTGGNEALTEAISRKFSVPSEVAAVLNRSMEASLDEAAQTLSEINKMTYPVFSSSDDTAAEANANNNNNNNTEAKKKKNHYSNFAAASITAKGELWSDVRLGSCLRPHLQKLPKLWELLVAGEDVAVLGPDARTVSAAVIGLRSLLGAVPYIGNMRPFLTINNREVDGVEAARDRRMFLVNNSNNSSNNNHNDVANNFSSPNSIASPSPSVVRNGRSPNLSPQQFSNNNNNNHLHHDSLPAAAAGYHLQQQEIALVNDRPSLIGATNPFFVKHFELWPHLICFGDELDNTHKMYESDTDKRSKQQFKLKTRMFSSRHYLIKSDKSVLEQLASAAKKAPALTSPSITTLVLPPSSSGGGTAIDPSPTSPKGPSNPNNFGPGAASENSSPSAFSGAASALTSPQYASTNNLTSPVRSNGNSATTFLPRSAPANSTFTLMDYPREVISSLNSAFFSVLENVVDSVLYSTPETLLYISDESLAGLFDPQSLLEVLREQPASCFDKFKSPKEALLVYASFLHTQTFIAWLQRHIRCFVRQQFMTCGLGELMRRCNNNANSSDIEMVLDSRIDMLHLLQWELVKQLEAPVLDVEYLERLYILNRSSMPLRGRLWSEL